MAPPLSCAKLFLKFELMRVHLDSRTLAIAPPSVFIALFLEKVDGDYNTLFGISPNKIYKELKKLGYSIEDFEFKDN